MQVQTCHATNSVQARSAQPPDLKCTQLFRDLCHPTYYPSLGVRLHRITPDVTGSSIFGFSLLFPYTFARFQGAQEWRDSSTEADASSYARLWGLIGEGESIDARLAADTPRLLPLLSLNEIATGAASADCIATLIFGPHTKFPIRAMYTLFPLADGTRIRVESAFILPESGMAQVNLLQGMQKGVLNVLFERELSDQATKARSIEPPVTATAPPIAPSFDCAKAGTDVERLICSSQELARADAELAPLYRAALASAPDKQAFRDEGKDWIRLRNGCYDEACLSHMYQTRIKQLRDR